MAHLPIATRRATFDKKERLKSKSYIDALFEEGKTHNVYPFRVIHRSYSNLKNHQVLFSVPKKRVRSAVERNALKRKMREAYRLHKHFLLPGTEVYLSVAYLYIGRDRSCSYNMIEKSLVGTLHYLNALYGSKDDTVL